ncbi:bud emergence protein 1 [Malassezia vespertilionis]|uniref:Bem1p n=1 Tax=Malassezia vespertilionis TaxID=2020962 RepID=A0A2N1JAW8_9BASI|nr:bud emergence protein 1 [Malassezia vespertilionis]PKI83687.1 Bem1p [Malassezia vespertilionis]WFD07418.1 bud emergence protein 1 [Malassezia vespertilionis]
MGSLRDLRATWRDRTTSSSRSSSRSVSGSHEKRKDCMQPPKQVIRATADYVSQTPYELSFRKGDFFHVMNNQLKEQAPGWIEACNPITNARGFVPEAYFDVLHRSAPSAAFDLVVKSDLNPSGVPPDSQTDNQRSGSTTPRPMSNWFATVKYNYVAERPQEMSVKEGDGILVLARSGSEWIVAKSFARLGPPGLIPMSHVVFRDTATGEQVSKADAQSLYSQMPSAQEWEKTNEQQRQNAIPLGKFDNTLDKMSKMSQDGPFPFRPDGPRRSLAGMQNATPQPSAVLMQSSHSENDSPKRRSGSWRSPSGSFISGMDSKWSLPSSCDQSLNTPQFLPAGVMVSATVEASHVDNKDYWYRLRVSYASMLHSPNSSEPLQWREMRDMTLFRLYEDFQEFHEGLLQDLAASNVTKQYTLPTMPGPPTSAAPHAAVQKLNELDAYLQQLAALPDEILRSASLRSFLELRPGDRCGISVSSCSNGRGSNTPLQTESPVFDVDLATQLQALRMKQCTVNTDGIPSPSNLSSSGVSDMFGPAGTLRTTPYHRIKVMRRGDVDQMLAVRMPTQFTRQSLLLKVQERLGDDIRVLQLDDKKDSLMINSDEELSVWLQSSIAMGKKLLLYADV